MPEFPVDDIDRLPKPSRPLLRDSGAGLGTIPNLPDILVESLQAPEVCNFPFNGTNHITETPVDRAFESFAWPPASAG